MAAAVADFRVADVALDDATERAMHKTIDAVRGDYASLGFNTAIAQMMVLKKPRQMKAAQKKPT